jgi:hypothetical protein
LPVSIAAWNSFSKHKIRIVSIGSIFPGRFFPLSKEAMKKKERGLGGTDVNECILYECMKKTKQIKNSGSCHQTFKKKIFP